MASEKPHVRVGITLLAACIQGPAIVLVGLAVIKRWPSFSYWPDWCGPVVNWVCALFALVLWQYIFTHAEKSNRRLNNGLVAGAILVFLAEGLLYLGDTFFRRELAIDWPPSDASVPSNEAVVGGEIRNIAAAETTITVYVCVKTSDTAQCYKDPNPAPIVGRVWSSRVRLGNEHPDNDHGRPEFFVVAVAVPSSLVSRLPSSKELFERHTSDAAALGERLRALQPLGLAGPVRYVKERLETPLRQFTAIAHAGAVEPLAVPALRLPNYAICPPATISWAEPAPGESPVVEAYKDGVELTEPEGKADRSGYKLERWPKGVERIEIKIASKRGGPYDSVWLKDGACR